MKIEVARHERMTESGSSLLRLIQNQNIPLLDLLIRESIQNSLDACTQKATSVNVEVIVGDFDSKELNRHFEKIDTKLNKKYGSQKGKFIAVKDSNTFGLTGPVRYTDVKKNNFGNLLKLVYEISKPQQNEGAGGSWGLGKTIYFRVGIGLVIYYSRILENGKYSSRLAACLVEDETKPHTLIPEDSSVKRGIAWWGKRDGLTRNSTIPIDSEYEIERFLSLFHIPRYKGTETGTTVIIPYIDEKALLNEVYATNESKEEKPYWVKSLSDYLNIAAQRWYAPRLMNRYYKHGPFLRVSINGKAIDVKNMLSTFKAIHELYILANGYDLNDESLIVSGSVDYHVDSIDLRGVLNNTCAGKLAYAKFSRAQLHMDPPDNEKSPYQQVGNISVPMEGGNGPVIMFTRKPAMIAGYDFDGQWTHRMPRSAPDEYIIGLFVLNTSNELKNVKDTRNGKPVSLEEYVRQGEKADHALWIDRNIGGENPKIITNIQKNVINKIKKRYTEASGQIVHRQNIGLGHALAELLLPDQDFGKQPSQPPRTPPRTTPPRLSKKSTLQFSKNPQYLSDGSLKLNFLITLKGKVCELSSLVITDFKRFTAIQWEKDEEIGKKFPVNIESVYLKDCVLSSDPKKKRQKIDVTLTREYSLFTDDLLDVEMLCSSRYETLAYIDINPKGNRLQLNGEVVFTFDDKGIKGGLDIKEIS